MMGPWSTFSNLRSPRGPRLPDVELVAQAPDYERCFDLMASLDEGSNKINQGQDVIQYKENYMLYLHQQVRLISRWLGTCFDDSSYTWADLCIAVAKELKTNPNVALGDIVTILYTKRFFHGDPSNANKVVFCLTGWLTMLFEPDVDKMAIDHRSLCIKDCPFSRGPFQAASTSSYHQDWQYVSQPLNFLLMRFGPLVPERPIGDLSRSEDLHLSHLNFYNMQYICKVQVEWTSTLSSHLEFNRRHKILKIFRYPAICQILRNNGEKDVSFLQQIFQDRDQLSATPMDDNVDQSRAFLTEVLWSLDILFLYDSKSSRKLKKCLSGVANTDPLLQRLSNGVGSDHAGDRRPLSDNYSSSVDFPYLGHRMMELQKFSKGQPSSVQLMIRGDRRGIGTEEYYAFKAIFLIGGGTLVLTALQLIVSILQLSLRRS
ncbi:MAG: hypothetical protein M1814_005066 [Vezdaea aestivalis]|nr:MAG: hypothetical protein M1814_005066 [Vezdaea aestivalis]